MKTLLFVIFVLIYSSIAGQEIYNKQNITYPQYSINNTKPEQNTTHTPKGDSILIYIKTNMIGSGSFFFNTNYQIGYNNGEILDQYSTLFRYYLHLGQYKAIIVAHTRPETKLLFKEYKITDNMAGDTIFIDFNEANRVIIFNGTYIDGKKFKDLPYRSDYKFKCAWTYIDNPEHRITFGRGDTLPFNFCTNQNFIPIKFGQYYIDSATQDVTFYEYPPVYKPQTDTTWLTNTVDDFAKQTFQLNGLPNSEYDYILGFRYNIFSVGYLPLTQTQPGQATFNYYHNKTLVTNPPMNWTNIFYNKFSMNFAFRNWEDGQIFFHDYWYGTSANLFNPWANNDTVKIDNGPLNFHVYTKNTDTTIGLYNIYTTFHSWLSHPNWQRSYTVTLTDHNKKQIIKTIINSETKGDIEVEPGIYSFNITDTNYFIGGNSGLATLNSTFDLTKNDKQPPTIHNIQIRNSDNYPWHRLKVGEQCNVVFSISEHTEDFEYRPALMEKTKVWAKTHGTTEWEELSLNYIEEIKSYNMGFVYSANLTPYTQQAATAFDIKFYCEDSVGNNTYYTLEPAGCTKGYEIPFLIPVANADTIHLHKNHNSATANILANDIGEKPFNLTMKVIDLPKNGELNWKTDGEITYTPKNNFYGVDSCSYIAYNGLKASELTYSYFIVDTTTNIFTVNNESDIYLYPNPSSGSITIKGLTQWQNCQITFYNITGKSIKSHVLKSKNQTINTSDMNKGLYIYEITRNNETINVGKCILQ